MKVRNEKMKDGVLTLAVQSALIAMFALPLASHAEGSSSNEAAVMKRPTNSIEFSITNVSRDSAKFGEYNGLDQSGINGIANVNMQGGNAYDSEDGITRWQIKGTDLGTSSRELGATISNQGQWSLGVGYDELTHNITDSYQTPYLGSMGGNQFTLPTGFGVAANTNVLNATQKSKFYIVDINTNRKNTSIVATYNFNPQLDIKLDINHLDQSGAKPMAFASASILGASAQTIAILPNPTNYTTDTVNLAINWAGIKGNVNASYFGSFFHDDFNRVNFTTFAGANSTQTMSTAPDNNFHQLNLIGGYSFSSKTKLVGGLSYGRNTQNDTFAYDSGMALTAIPRSTLDGVVVTSHGDLKLTDSTIKNLTLSAGIKYDERDNQTQSNIYNFKSIGYTTTNNSFTNYPNTPLSNKKIQLELAGDYRLTNKQHIRLAFNREDVSRWCNQYAVNAGYPVGTNCVVATDSTDNKLSANYKLNATEDLHLNIGYAFSDRKTDSDTKARAAINGILGNVGTGTVKGINAGDYLGYYPYFNSSRKQQMVKAGVDWQANDKLSMGLSGQYTDDNYDAQYGVQNGNSWSMNLDATYSYNSNGSISAYLTKEHRERDMTNLQRSIAQGATLATATAVAVPAGATWTNNLNDNDITFGIAAKQVGLMKGKLALSGDLTYSLGETGYGTQLNYNTKTTTGRTCSALSILSCGQLPDINNRMIQLKLAGDYKLNKNSAIKVGYQYQHLISDDYFYNAYMSANTPTSVLPTNQQAGSYSNNLITATYTYIF